MTDIQLRVEKFLTNPLLQRKQFVLNVIHPTSGSVPKAQLREKLAKMFRVADSNCVVVTGMKTVFGGGKSSGFGLIYDNINSLKKFEPKYRLVRAKLAEPKPSTVTRRGKKDMKIRQKKVRGTAKAKISGTGKK